VSVIFAIAGFLSATWVARIPAVSSKLDLDTAQLGTLLLFIGIGSLVGFQIIGGMIERFGSARTSLGFGVGYLISLSLLALSPNAIVLGVVLLFYGFAFGSLDVAMNAQGVTVERGLGKPIMGSLHGFFSLGALLGAVAGGGVAGLGIGVTAHFILCTIVGLVVLFWANEGQIPDEVVAREESAPKRRFGLPPRSLWVLGLIAFFAAVGEGGMGDWSALYIRDEIGSSEGLAALGFSAFSLTMLIGRFAGDKIVATFGAVRVVGIGSAISAIGMLIAVLPGTLPTALIGFAIMGIGLAPAFPIVYSAAGATPGIASGAAVAAVATIGYTGFLLGPPVLGWVGHVTGLKGALLIVAALLAAIVPFAGALGRAPKPSTEVISTH